MTENLLPSASYTYDPNGNMTCRMESGKWYIQTYNTENRISSIMKLRSGSCADSNPPLETKWDFAYDGDGVRVATLTTTYDANGAPDGSSWTAYYFGGAYEVRSDGTAIKYYSFAGQMVAMNDGTGLQYFLTDHLGSIVAITDATGTLTSQQRYLPFGAERTDVTSPSAAGTDYGYTGQRELDPSTGGLMDYKARFYSVYLNRFVQPDSIVPNMFYSQSLNRYAYVNNSPVNYVDPSGHICVESDGDSDVGMAGNCGGGSNPNFKKGLQGNPSGYTQGRSRGNEDTVPVCSSSICNPSGTGSPPVIIQQNNRFTQAVQDIWDSFNWSVQTPGGFTIAQTSGFPFLTGFRFYGDAEVTFQNNSPVTVGPTTISNGQFDIGSDNFVFQTGPSSVGILSSTLGIDIGNPLAPWGFDVSADYSVTNQNVTTTYTLGIEAVARPDNTALAAAPGIIYVVSRVPALIPLMARIIQQGLQQGQPQCVPGFNC